MERRSITMCKISAEGNFLLKMKTLLKSQSVHRNFFSNVSGQMVRFFMTAFFIEMKHASNVVTSLINIQIN